MGDTLGEIDTDGLPGDVVGFRRLVAVVRDLEPGTDQQAIGALGAWSHAHGLAAPLVDGPLRAIAADRDRVPALAERVLALPDQSP